MEEAESGLDVYAAPRSSFLFPACASGSSGMEVNSCHILSLLCCGATCQCLSQYYGLYFRVSRTRWVGDMYHKMIRLSFSQQWVTLLYNNLMRFRASWSSVLIVLQ